MLTTIRVELDAADEATAHSVFLFLDESQIPPALASSGRYVDTVRRDGDAWRLAVRRIVLDS